jgi:hypothetical protein
VLTEVFKAQKATLFVLDEDIIKFMFTKNDRSQNYKKIMLTGSNLIYAVFNNPEEFAGPIFKNMVEAGNYMCNNKVIIIPLKEGRKTLMSL